MKYRKPLCYPASAGLALSVAAMLSGPLSAQLAVYEFTDNSLAVTDLDGADGITFSNVSLNSYTTDEAFSDAGDAVADPTLDYISLNGVESPNGTSSAFSGGDYLSFTITNNSGDVLNLEKFSGDFNKTNVYQQFQARVFETNAPASVTDDTIARLGAASGGTGLEQDEAVMDGTSGEAGANWTGVPYTIADGASATFHFPFNMNSNSNTRYMGIDNIAIEGSTGAQPNLTVDPLSIDPDFDFAFVNDDPSSTSLPVSRTVTYVNDGGADVTITNVALSGDDAAAFSFSTIPAIPGGGLTLTPTDTIEVTVDFDTAASGSGTYQAQVDITTDVVEQDKAEPVTVDYGIIGESVISNGNFEDSPFNEGWTGNNTSFGGLAPGSTTASRTSNGHSRNDFTQPLYDDFDVSFFFAVEAYDGTPDGGDRNFNVRVTRGGNTNTFINLAYLPGADFDGDLTLNPGFYVNDGTTWQAVIFDNGNPTTGNQVTISDSLDNNADGDYDDSGDGDVKNVYFMRIIGNEFHSGAADSHFYNLYLYDSTGTLIGSDTDVQFVQSGDPADAEQPIQAINFSSNGGANQDFVFDDVSVHRSVDNGSGLPVPIDPDLQIVDTPEYGTFDVILDPTGTYSSNLIVRNAPDASGNLNISAINLSDATHYAVNGALPGPIAPGATATVQIDFTPGLDRGEFPCTIGIVSDDSLTDPNNVEVSVAAWDDGDLVNADNCDFESTPFDTSWNNSGATLAAGLNGSQAAYIPAGNFPLSRDVSPGGDFEFDFYFAALDGNREMTARILNPAGNVLALSYGETGNEEFAVNNGGGWTALPSLGSIDPSVDGNDDDSLDDVSDTVNLYRVRIVGRGFGTAGANYDIFVSDANSSTFTRSATDLTVFADVSVEAGPPVSFDFNNAFGGGNGYWVDDACMTATVTPVDDPNLAIDTEPVWADLVGTPVDDQDLVLSNSGAANDLNITAINFSGPDAANFSLAPSVTLPVVIAAGGNASIPIRFDQGASPSGSFTATLEITSDDVTDVAYSLTPTVALSVVSVADGDKVLTNWDFEASPFDTDWNNDGGVTQFGGFNTVNGSSTQAAQVAATANLSQATPTGISDFSVEFYFAMSNVSGRSMNFRLFGNTDQSGNAINTIRYMGDVDELQAYDGTTWQPLVTSAALAASFDADSNGSLEDPGDIRNVYRLRVDGRGYGTAGAEYDVHLLQEDGTSIGSALSQTYFRADGTANDVESVEFNADSGTPTFWVDDVCLTYEAPATGDAYDTYAAGITSGPTGFEDDANGDGTANGLNFVLGGDADVVDNSILPDPTAQPNGDLVFEFERADEAVGITTLTFQWATELATWNDVPVLAGASGPDGNGVTVAISDGSPTDTVTITVPAANAPDGRIFGRLRATRP